MNKENLDLLKNILRSLGFGDDSTLIGPLEGAIRKGLQKFQLYTKAYFDEFTKLEGKLYFDRTEQPDRYVFTKYDCSLRYRANPDKNRLQTFFINNDEGISFKEAFNLLQGRSVNKDLVSPTDGRYNAWVRLNFGKKDPDGNYKFDQYRTQNGYDLEKVLGMYPIKELTDEEAKPFLILSLKKGNMPIVTFEKPSKTEKMFIEANPMFKTINIYPVNHLRYSSNKSSKR